MNIKLKWNCSFPSEISIIEVEKFKKEMSVSLFFKKAYIILIFKMYKMKLINLLTDNILINIHP